MEVRIKSEKEYPVGVPCSSSNNISSPSPSALRSKSTVTLYNGTKMALITESLDTKFTPKRQDVPTNVAVPPPNMPAIDLRIVKQERIDEDELKAQGIERRSPTRESDGSHHRGSSLLEQETQSPRIQSAKDSMAFVSVRRIQDDSRTSKENDEDKSTISRSRYSKGIEPYPYRVPIVYPIHSPPIDYRSINSDRSPTPNSYPLEDGEKPLSPMINQRQLYEDSHWPSMENREVELQENHSSGYTGCKSARNSPPRQNSPLTSHKQEGAKEGSPGSPKDPTHSISYNSEKAAAFVRRRVKNSERHTSAEDDKEEESLWKQVQRYRHRKRPALGKLYPTQEETIFMQYNEIRERRHREGRITTRTGRPVISHCNSNREQSLTPPPDSTVDQADSKLQVFTRVPEPAGPPKPIGIDSYGSQAGRTLVVEFPKSKGLVNNCITGPSHEMSTVQRSPSFNSTGMDSHKASNFDGNTERKKPPNEQLENSSIPTHVKEYQNFAAPSTHACTGHQSQQYRDVRGIDGRAVDARGSDARGIDARGNDARGIDARGNDARGNDARGIDARGIDARGIDARDNDARGNDARGIDARGIDARGIDARGIDARVVAHSALDCRGTQSYEECCHNVPPHRPHRLTQPQPRFHLEDPACYDNSCHDHRRRQLSSCGNHCCNHKRSRRVSCDNADEYDENNESNHWQYSPKEKRSRPEQDSGRDLNDPFRRDHQPGSTQNGSQPFSPSSSDSRENESMENGQNQDFESQNEGQLYENEHASQEGSPQMPHGENDSRFPHTSPFPLGEREPDDDDVICHVNGLFSLPGYRETKYDITRGELKRRTEPPETLTRVEMISYVRQAKTSGRILLDTNGITTSNRSHPTILSRVCEREAQVLACGIHKMNLECLPLKKLVQICVDMYKSRGCDGCQDCRLKLRRRIVDVEITRNMLKEFLHVFQEASTEGFLDSFELASHTFGTVNLVNNIKLIDEYHKLLLMALEKE